MTKTEIRKSLLMLRKFTVDKHIDTAYNLALEMTELDWFDRLSNDIEKLVDDRIKELPTWEETHDN